MSTRFLEKIVSARPRFLRGTVVAILILTLLVLAATASPVQAKAEKSTGIRVYQERRGVTRFEEYIPLSPELGLPPGSFYKVNVYAFSVGGGVVLIDCGAETLYTSLTQEIGKRFHNKPILAVLLTHGHADHAGSGHYFVEAGIPVYASMADVYLIQMGMNFPGVPRDFTYTGYTPTGVLHGGEMLFGLSVVPTPGHTLGSLSYASMKTDALFSGDTTISQADDDVAPEDMTFELEYMTLLMTDKNSLQMQIDSLNLLLGLANSGMADTILPGHNRTYHSRDVQPYIQNSIDVVTQILMS